MLTGGEGDDFYLGGVGADTFVFQAGQGADFIGDFQAGTDVIELSGFGVTTFAGLENLMTEAGGNTFINFTDGSLLTLENVTIAQLNSGDFLLL